MFFSLFLLLQSQPPQAQPQADFGTVLRYYAPQLILVIAVFYFLMVRPQQQRNKKQQQMLRDLKSGDTVVTTGGIVGTVTTADNDTIVLRVKPDNLKLQFARSAVTMLVPPEGSK